MALKLPADGAAFVAFQSIGCGYDISLDLRLKYVKGAYIGTNPYRMCRLIEIDEDEGRDIMLPGGILVLNVPKSIKCDKGERTRFQSGVLPFQQMSEQFNHELSLAGIIPSGLFDSMFGFRGNWQKDALRTKTLALDGIFISLYSVALEKTRVLLCDHVKNDVPSSWEPALLARFIENFGTHVIVGVKMGGKDVIYMKQQHASSLEPADVQKRLNEMADKRFLDSYEQLVIDLEHISQDDKDVISICKRRGGSDDRNLKHNEWLHTVQSEPDVITMSFIPITSLLNGVLGSGYLSHAINLYLCYKPPIEELRQFLEFQLPKQWAPVFSHLSLAFGPQPQRDYQNTFSFSGPELHVNTNPVDVGKRPVTGLRLYLEGKRSNCLAIHLQHLSSLPEIFQLEDSVTGIGIYNSDSDDRRYYEKVQWKHFSHVCTAPVESEDEQSIVTGAHLHVGFKKVLFLRLHFSKLVGCIATKIPEWDSSPGLESQTTEEVNINSAIYPGGPPCEAPELSEYVDTMEMTRGPQESPGYWVVSGARFVVDKGKISLRVKYSLLTVIFPDDDDDEVSYF
ncbi:MACPF domain-containing protein At4g24290 [Lactuca sativa]|uniref:MACPF domain-containing protein At4g24290 n=1 Tax=Lactuca sativa TaxID=4236 RepID=UPI0022AFEEB2|nr:MACPF domain-containing protein At4g24290 [Lactuca sativa]